MALSNLSLDSGVQFSRADLTPGQRWILTVGAALLHGLAAIWIWHASSLPVIPPEAAPLMVSLISEEARPAQPESQPVKPPAPVPTPKPVVQPTPPRVTPPVLASTKLAHQQDAQVPVVAPETKPAPPADTAPPPSTNVASTAPAAAPSAPEPSGPPPVLNLPSSAVRIMLYKEPVYPPASKELNETGPVTVLLLIDETGHVKNVTVTKTSGFPRLDRAAVASYTSARFYPHVVNGVARSVNVSQTINFNLDQR